MVLTLVELCFISIMEKMEYNNESLQKVPLNLIEKLINFMVTRLHPNHLALQTISKPIKIKLSRQNRIITMRFSIYSNIDKIINQIYERVLNEEKMEYISKNKKALTTNTTTTTTTSISPSKNNPNNPNIPNSPNNNNNNNTINNNNKSNDDIINNIIKDSEENDDLINFQSSWGNIENYGLFQLSSATAGSRWLKLDRTLAFYEIDSNEILEFKNTKTVLKIKFFGPWERVVHPLHQSTMFDETIKTFIIDESKTVSEISQDLAKKLLLKYPEELSLKRQQDEDDSLGIWLSSDLTLPEQNVDPMYSIFLLKRQFFFSKDTIIDFSMDQEMSHFVFCQCLDAIIDGSHPCTQVEAVLFAALQCQIYFSDYSSHQREMDQIRLKDILPVEYINQKNILKEILVQYQKLTGMTEQKAKLNFIQLAKSLKSYGYSFFKVTSQPSGVPLLFGISSEAILLLDPDNKNTISLYSLGNVKKWQILNNIFSIDFSDRKENFHSLESESISHVLSSYIHYNLRNKPSVQKQWDQNYLKVGRITSNRRLSACSTDSNDSLSHNKNDRDWKNQYGLSIKKSALYIEPKKLYFNPLFNQNGTNSNILNKEFNKDTKVTKVLKVLTDLSSKMMQSFSKTSTAGAHKEREIVVKFSDKKVKRFIVDESRTVAEITLEIGQKLGIKNTEEFSLQVLFNQDSNNNNNNNNNVNNNNNNNSYISNSSGSSTSPSTSPTSSFINLNNSIDDTFMFSNGGVWLKPYKSLFSQNIPNDSKLLFKKKFYTSDTAADDCNNDPVYFNLLFFQSKDAIISNTYTCSKEEAIQLAATLFQINFGDHNPNIHKPGFLKSQDLKFFLPPNSLELWGVSFQKIEKSIYKEHQNLRGIKEVYAKYRYVQLCRSLKTFGAIFFTVTRVSSGGSSKDGKDNSGSSNNRDSNVNSSSSGSSDNSTQQLPTNTQLLIGFSRKCILFMTVKSKKFLIEYPLSQLKRWAYQKSQNMFILDFGDYDQGRIVFQSFESEDISMYLSDYVDYIQTKLVGSHSYSTSILSEE